MKAQFKTFAVVVLMSGMVFSSLAQINLLSDYIQFRNYNDANNGTTHYGDFNIDGGSTGDGWGWLTCERAYVYGLTTLYGDLNVYGTKNFVHPHPTDTTKVIKYIAIESGEALTLARGTASTVNGQAIVTLPEHFKLVTSTDAPVTVILTPEEAPVLLYTKEKSKDQIVIGMKDSDFYEFGDVTFSFQVTGVRDGFEDEKVIVNIAEKAENDNISAKRAEYNEKVKKAKALTRKLNNENKSKRK
jgi:hypothetical protein